MINRKRILFFLFSILTSYAFSQDYNFRNFSSEDGFAQSFVYSVNQDARGYLWIGTGNGLSRYNGFVFENYTTSDSLADNFVTTSIRDGEDMWFGHYNGRLSYYNGKEFRPINMPISNLSPVTHFAKSPDGEIWVSTYSDGLMKINKESGVAKHKLFTDKTEIITFEFLNDNELLAGTNNGLLYCRVNESEIIEIVRPVLEITGSKVTCIQKMRNRSGFYVATENDGIFRLTFDGNLPDVLKIVSASDFDFSGIQDIYEDSQSNLWEASKGNGLIKMIISNSGELTKVECFNKSTGFPTDNVETVYEDRDGNIWSGNYGEGLTQVTPKIFSVYTFDKQLFGKEVFSICSSGQYRWVGTENGLLKMDGVTGKIIRFYGKGSGLPKDTVTAIYSNDGKVLWIGTGKNGLFLMETESEKILNYSIGDGALENSITIITGKEDEVWIGTKKGLCNINSGTNRMIWYTINKGGLPHNYINCLYVDRKDRLWVSTRSNALSYIQDKKVFKMPFNSLSGILTITEDSDSRIWIGSNGNGVYMIGSDSVANITTKEGLQSNYCYSIICDDYKNIWVGHKDGLSRIRTNDFFVKPIQHFGNPTDRFQFNPNASFKDKLGEIWFGSDMGMISIDPSLENTRYLPPVLGITSIRINDDEIDYSGKIDKIILPPDNYKIRIDFLGISLKEPGLVTYQYKLNGYDQWSEIVRNAYITYPRLSDGNYTFFLKASSGDGAVTENPLTLNIIINKPVWKKLWFYSIIVSLLAILFFIYIKSREYRFLSEKKILEEKVAERTYEIQCQKNEIELQRDLIDEKNTNITSSIRYASHIQNAILPPLELLDKLLPENFILNRPKDIVSGDFYWLAEKDGKIVLTVADCTGHGVPGAFMSLLGITLLNEIVNVEGITRSDAIVTKLRERVIRSLQQSRKDIPTSDGMDIALCVLDQSNKRIQFTGGMSNLVFIRDKKIEIIQADRFSVCILYGNAGPFALKEFDCRKGDVFYLFSDGYQDQFGGDLDKKYLKQHFYLTLLEIHELPMPDQKVLLEDKLNEWMKDKAQTDDITVMGIRL